MKDTTTAPVATTRPTATSATGFTCPYCGPDANGVQIHQLTHHANPKLTLDQATAEVAKEAKEPK